MYCFNYVFNILLRLYIYYTDFTTLYKKGWSEHFHKIHQNHENYFELRICKNCLLYLRLENVILNSTLVVHLTKKKFNRV